MPDASHPTDDREQLELADIVSRVLDRGVVITGTVLISVADVDLIRLSIGLYIAAIETERARDSHTIARMGGRMTLGEEGADGDVAVLPPAGRR